MNINDTDKIFCSILFDVMAAKGVEDVVCSPGSRNAPLLIAAAARDNLRKHVATDERAAAFIALGMAAVSQRPVALVCTSGTALLNYAPAVAEAFYQSVPLIVISADRPEQWIDQDDSQTLRQFEALGNFVKRSYQLPATGYENAEMQWYANRIANDAMIEATSGRRGPVHINVQLGEPLSRKQQHPMADPRVISMIGSDIPANKEIIRGLALEVAASRVMLVAGFLPPDSRLNRAVNEFIKLPNVVAMTETLSNLHLPPECAAIDSVLTAFSEEELDRMAPDLVISVGGSLVSRKLKEYLRRNKHRCRHWQLGWSHTTADCFMSLTARIEASPSRVLHQLAAIAAKEMKGVKGEESYSRRWQDMRRRAAGVKERFVADAPWSELKAFSHILAQLPTGYNLFLSNGTSVRYAQILSHRLPHASYCNRGVSGIDGSGSTAAGGAKMYKGNTLLITGDLSMAYDIAMFGLPDIPDRMRVIVMDNAGGGIFRFIPSTSALEERERYFCAPPTLPLRQLADGYGWEYSEVADGETLREELPRFFGGDRRKLLRVVCDGVESAEVLKRYMQVKA